MFKTPQHKNKSAIGCQTNGIYIKSVMFDVKSKNICTEGHLKNDNYPHPTLKKLCETILILFFLLRNVSKQANITLESTRIISFYLVRGTHQPHIFFQGLQLEKHSETDDLEEGKTQLGSLCW